MDIGSSITAKRAALGISQEKLAEVIGVSRQAVQKWESGAAEPDVRNLAALADFFGVPADLLLFGRSARDYEGLSPEVPKPDYAGMHGWDSYMKRLEVEYRQCVDEGRDVAAYREFFEAVQHMPDGPEKEAAAEVVYSIVCRAGKVAGYLYNEPSDAEGIKALRTGYMPEKTVKPAKGALREKIHGAWLGRIAGCLAGKTVEGISSAELEKLLKETGNWPMRRYIRASKVTDEVCERYAFKLRGRCYADTVECAPTDDDTNYTVLAAKIVGERGRDFTPENVAEAWRRYQSVYAYCTAERVAYRNFINGYLPPASAVYKNPYREWIGAQIRGDYYGYINPGDPAEAADMARRDACISHVANGIYGEMFVAAAIAGAAVCKGAREAILVGMGQIPRTSRLYEALDSIIALTDGGAGYDDCIAHIRSRFNDRVQHDWCHTISNAMIVAAALLCGNGDYTTTVGMAVQPGFDTDCNGATAGSIFGMLHGRGAIGAEWTEPLRDQLDTSIFGVGRIKISEIADETLQRVK